MVTIKPEMNKLNLRATILNFVIFKNPWLVKQGFETNYEVDKNGDSRCKRNSFYVEI